MSQFQPPSMVPNGPYAQPPMDQAAWQQQPARPGTDRRGFAIAGMVLGIVSLMMWCVAACGFVIAVPGLVLSCLEHPQPVRSE